MSFKFLYAFTCPKLSIVEVKRTDLPEGTPVDRVYHWLVIRGSLVTKLTFKSMERGEIEKREFHEGKFSFNTKEGELELSSERFTVKSFLPDASISVAISNYLAGTG